MRAFAALKTDPKPSYDAVVIGAGIGGLICANLLARAKLRVLLVEQHFMAGGFCSTFRRAGFTFDAATHFYPLLGNPSSFTGSLLQRLGSQTRWVKMDPVDQFHFPDGSRFKVSADLEAYLAALRTTFPQEQEALDQFFALAREAYMYGILHFFRGHAHQRLEPMKHLTLHEVLARYFKDPKLRLLLSADCAHWGSPPTRTSFVFDAMLRLSYFQGNYYPEGGSQVFADDLAATFVEQGGEILMQSSVERIIVEGGVATGVAIDTGVRSKRHRVLVHARYIVSNADLVLTLEKLLGAETIGQDAIDAVKRLRPTTPCFLTHIGLHDVPKETLDEASGYHWRSWDAAQVRTEAFKIFVPTLYEPRMAPPGGQIIILQALDADYETVTDWAAHKAAVEQDLMERLEAALPGVRSHVVTCSSASALTSWRYTLNYRGAMLGWEMSPDQLAWERPAIEGPVRNLYLTGHWTRPGGGITPVIVSAIDAAREITRGREATEGVGERVMRQSLGIRTPFPGR